MLVAAVAILLAVIGTGALWVSGTGPFGSRPSAGKPSQPAVDVMTPFSDTSTQSAAPSGPALGSGADDFSGVYSMVQSGVGRVAVDSCDGAFAGSGFLVSPTTMVTAAHVVEGATDVQVSFDGDPVDATVVGVDVSTDLAMLAIPTGSGAGHVFDLAAQDPEPGTRIAVIGYPLDEPKSLTEGTISGLGRSISTDSGTHSGLIQTDAAINPGNSGGPLLDDSGQVVGVADAIRTDAQGIGFAVPISQARVAIGLPSGLSSPGVPSCERPAEREASVTRTLHSYLAAINLGDYDAAMSLVGGAMRAKTPRDQWTSDFVTTHDDRLTVRSVTGSATVGHVWATFRSRQQAGYGPLGAVNATCLVWTLDYTMSRTGSSWVIDDASGHGDPGWVRCD